MIDKLKIDQSFVKEIGQSADADAIVRAMINLARSLNLQVTAEGVETVTQRERLAAIGCQELQGHSLSTCQRRHHDGNTLGRQAGDADKRQSQATSAAGLGHIRASLPGPYRRGTKFISAPSWVIT